MGGRTRLLVVVGGGAATLRSRAVAARGALGAPAVAVGMPAAVRAGGGYLFFNKIIIKIKKIKKIKEGLLLGFFQNSI